MTEPEPISQTLTLLGDKARRTAVMASSEAIKTVIRAQAAEAGSGDDIASGQLMYSDVHSGDSPITFDALARESSMRVVRSQLDAFAAASGNKLVEVGEEAGVATAILRSSDLLARLDVLDGSTNARVTLSDFSSVVLIDQVRSRQDGSLRAHHLAGAIAVANGWTISWVNQSRFDKAANKYHRVVGDVFASAEPWGVAEFEVVEPSLHRKENSTSAVASKAKRREEALRIMGPERADGVFYNFGGTPIVAALLMGQIENVIEPAVVTLHDSAHLLPHQLLRGDLVRADDSSPIDFLALYEEHALNPDPTHKPVPPYWARVPQAG